MIEADRFVSHRSFAHAEPFVLLAWQALRVDPRQVPEYSEPLLAVEGLVTILLRLVKQAVARRVKVRPVLCELNSIRYDLDLAGIVPERGAPGPLQSVSPRYGKAGSIRTPKRSGCCCRMP